MDPVQARSVEGTTPPSPSARPDGDPTNLITPARVAKESGSTIGNHVERFVSKMTPEHVASLSFENLALAFKTGFQIQSVIDRTNAFAGRAQPSEELVEELSSLAREAADDIEGYERAVIAVLPDSEAALVGFVAEVLSKVTFDPAQDVPYQREAGEKAAALAEDYFRRTRGEFRLAIADLSDEDIATRLGAAATSAVAWFKSELAVQLHFQAARGIPEEQLKAEITPDDFACTSDKAAARAAHFEKIERLDDEQDERLTERLRPVMAALASAMHGSSEGGAGKIPEVWLKRISSYLPAAPSAA